MHEYENTNLDGMALVAAVAVQARTTELSIGECRTLAIQNNKELRMADEREQAACHRRKAAFTNYLPRISAAGAYLHTSDELSLLSDEQKNTLGRLGTNASGQLQGILQQYPSLGEQFGPVAVRLPEVSTLSGRVWSMVCVPIRGT